MSKFLLVVVLAVAAGLVFAASTLDPSLPGISQAPAESVGPTGVPVVQTTLSGAQRVDLDLVFSEPAVIDSGDLAGRVTGLPAQPGDLIECGDTVIQVDGIDRPLFCSDIPLFRGLGSTETGADVVALHTFLSSMGFEVSDPGADQVIAETRRANRAYREQLGLLPGQVFEPAFVVYSPGPIVVGEISVRVGERMAAEQTIFATEQTVLAAGLGFDGALAERAYVVELAGVDFDVVLDGRKGSVIDLDGLGAVVDPDRNFVDDPLTGELRLADELDVMSVPTSSVVSDGDTLCVVDEASGLAVNIVLIDSRTGSTFFLPVPSLVGGRVLVDPFTASPQCQ